MTQRILLVTGILGPVALLGAWSLAQNGAAPPKGPTAKEKFKNIKVLKDLPADQLLPLMHAFNDSLGVRCDFCHVERQFDKDNKPAKNMARKMIVMTNDLNAHEKILDKKATCYMCHHGHPEPETRPSGAGAPERK